MCFFLGGMIMRPEILAPAGNQESLDAALLAGCDAVYFALNSFGARAYAKNFTLEQAQENIKKCHLYGVHVHVTMNTVIYEDEMEAAYRQAKSLYEMGVDALIVQDLGLIHLLHHRLPDLEIHASTQMSIMNREQIERLKRLGVKRVVLARECTKEEIIECKKAGLEIEVFAHGAICISQSGRCYLSSVCYGRSGNRGMCAQPCRMEYTMYEDGKVVDSSYSYLLSPKDLSLIDIVDTLDVDSLKIEGRMKSPEYVYEAVSQVKQVLDGQKRTIEDRKKIEYTFNREYTLGHYNDARGLDLMNMRTSNHQGVQIGKIIRIKKPYVYISLSEPLYQNDGIRIGTDNGLRVNFLYDTSLKLVNHVDAGDIALVKMQGAHVGDVVRKTVSSALETKVDKLLKETVRKQEFEMKISCLGIGHPLVCDIDGIQVISDFVSQEALSRVTDEKTLNKQLKKTGNTWVSFINIKYDLHENIFFTIKEMNEFRRQIIRELERQRTSFIPSEEMDYDFVPSVLDQYQIYVDDIPDTVASTDWNVTNSYAVAACLEMGYEQVLLSEECTLEQCIAMSEAFKKRYRVPFPGVKKIYHKQRLMIMKHCPVNTVMKDGQRKGCSLCHTHHFEMANGDIRMTCLGDEHCNMRLYSQQATNEIEHMDSYKSEGIVNFYIEFVDESESEKSHILSLIPVDSPSEIVV